jgi:recombinational DNA repair protein RecR
MNRLYKAYYYLTCFGGWTLSEGKETQIELIRAERRLFNCKSEQWETIPLSKMRLYNGTYHILKGALSYYDREVLEMLKFKLKK